MNDRVAALAAWLAGRTEVSLVGEVGGGIHWTFHREAREIISRAEDDQLAREWDDLWRAGREAFPLVNETEAVGLALLSDLTIATISNPSAQRLTLYSTQFVTDEMLASYRDAIAEHGDIAIWAPSRRTAAWAVQP